VLRPRIIPCLLVHDGGLVKTVGFKDPKYVGDPINAVKIFNEKEADELIVVDIDASVHGAEPNYRLISQFAAECRMPLCYGGGITKAEQARRIIGLGVEKIAIGAAAQSDPALITRVADAVGSQSVVAVLDSRRKGADWEVFTHNGKRKAARPVAEAAKQAQQAGAGEILVNSIDQDGRMKGYDLDLARQVRAAVQIPMTVLGGAGSLADIGNLFAACGVIGAAAGSFFVFKGAYRAVLISYPDPAQKESLFGALPSGT
jgi:cyclase